MIALCVDSPVFGHWACSRCNLRSFGRQILREKRAESSQFQCFSGAVRGQAVSNGGVPLHGGCRCAQPHRRSPTTAVWTPAIASNRRHRFPTCIIYIRPLSRSIPSSLCPCVVLQGGLAAGPLNLLSSAYRSQCLPVPCSWRTSRKILSLYIDKGQVVQIPADAFYTQERPLGVRTFCSPTSKHF